VRRAKVSRKTDDEIRAAISTDPDVAPELDDAWFAKAVVVAPRAKQLLSLRMDSDVLDWFKGNGKGYQTRINAVLRRYMDVQTKKA
jgi:uncharacterized protein (DUF4415 family)